MAGDEADGALDEFEEDWDGVEDDEDEEALLEADAGTAPWTPVPTWVARQFQQRNPDAVAEFIFPTVYEENRSEKIRDLATAKEQKWITHRRAAEQGVKELGFEEYEYDEEQDNIKAEEKAGIGQPSLGAGDELAKALGLGGGEPEPAGPTVPSAPAPATNGAPPARQRDDAGEPKRADLSSPEERSFRKQMRQAEAELRQVAAGLHQLRETVAVRTRLAEQAADGLPLDQRLSKAEVLYLEDGGPKRCDRCPMWIRDKNQCTIHREQDRVLADMVCYLYVNGEPTTSEAGARAGGYVTPTESGLGQGNTSCGNCIFGNGRPRCEHPALKNFPIDNTGGCCNAWRSLDGKARETVAPVSVVAPDLLLRRLTENIGKLAASVERRPVIVQPPEVHVEAPRVEVHPPEVRVPRPEVVHIPSPPHERKVVAKEVVYDNRGRAVRVLETDDRGEQRRLRIKRGDDGRVIALEPED